MLKLSARSRSSTIELSTETNSIVWTWSTRQFLQFAGAVLEMAAWLKHEDDGKVIEVGS